LKDSTESELDPIIVAAGVTIVTVGTLRLTGEPKARGRTDRRGIRDFMVVIGGDLRLR
jgi:hypothetical protein